jgi:glycosyltransferase involved in cell wall biosynthesis
LKIAVNTRLLLKNRLEGIGWFTKETLLRITKEHPEHEFLFIFDRAYDESYVFSPNVKAVVISPQARHPLLYRIYFNWSIPRILKKEKADLFLSPDGFLSLHTDVPQLAVIHDLNFEHHPEALPSVVSKYYRKYFPKFAEKAARIATVSNYSKLDIANTYTIDPSKIDVVYNGANELYIPLSDEDVKQVRLKYSHGLPYFLFIGSLHPRKNVVNLLKAYEQFRADSSQNIPLVIVGEAMWSNKDVEKELNTMTFKEDVIHLGRLQSAELKMILGASLALTFIPIFEGFGIPALEAMQSGVPVIASNTSSIPEVVGDAAILCDPDDIKQIAGAMEKVSENDQLRKELIIKGLEQSEKFSWDRSAHLLWKSIEKTMQDVKAIQ